MNNADCLSLPVFWIAKEFCLIFSGNDFHSAGKGSCKNRDICTLCPVTDWRNNLLISRIKLACHKSFRGSNHFKRGVVRLETIGFKIALFLGNLNQGIDDFVCRYSDVERIIFFRSLFPIAGKKAKRQDESRPNHHEFCLFFHNVPLLFFFNF